MKNRIGVFLVFCLAIIACNLPRVVPDGSTPGGPLPDLDTATLAPGETPQATPTLAPPTETLSPTATFTPQPTVTPRAGSIDGGIYGYPYGSVPGLVFVAFNQQNSSYWYWIIGAGQSFYSTDPFISPGKYRVVAYDSSGHRGGCTTIITVTSDATAHCDITDWAGSYPAKPSGVPSP